MGSIPLPRRPAALSQPWAPWQVQAATWPFSEHPADTVGVSLRKG